MFQALLIQGIPHSRMTKATATFLHVDCIGRQSLLGGMVDGFRCAEVFASQKSWNNLDSLSKPYDMTCVIWRSCYRLIASQLTYSLAAFSLCVTWLYNWT